MQNAIFFLVHVRRDKIVNDCVELNENSYEHNYEQVQPSALSKLAKKD